MKRIRLRIIIALCITTLLVLGGTVSAAKPACTTLQDGIYYSAGHYLEGELIPLGFDAYGYNYQGHMFSGSYANVYLGGDGFPPYEGNDDDYLTANPDAASHWAWDYRDVKLTMKWNDAWISNKDCDGDGKLDRHFGFDTYIGSGAWETNHMWGEYEGENGNTCKWNDFVKIVAVPADAYRVGAANNGVWYTADGTEIGPDIWGEFATIQEVYNDPCDGYHGLLYVSPTSAGFGYYMP